MYANDSKVILGTGAILRSSKPQENGGILTVATSHNLGANLFFVTQTACFLASQATCKFKNFSSVHQIFMRYLTQKESASHSG